MTADGLYLAVLGTDGDVKAPRPSGLSDHEHRLLTHLMEERAGGLAGFDGVALFAIVQYLQPRLSEAMRRQHDPVDWLRVQASMSDEDPFADPSTDSADLTAGDLIEIRRAPGASLLEATYEALADVLLDDAHYRAYRADPARYAQARLADPAASAMLAGLDPDALARTRPSVARFLVPFQPEQGQQPRRSFAESTWHGPRGSEPLALAPYPSRRPAIGLHWQYGLLPYIFDDLPLVQVWQTNVEGWVGNDTGRTGAHALAAFAASVPVALHCFSLSLASPTCLEHKGWIAAASRFVRATGVSYLSDHLGLELVGERRVPHFIPVWRTAEQLEVLVRNVDSVQELLGVRLALEYNATMLDLGGDLSTAAMLSEIAHRTGCGILLDLENLRLDELNGLVDARQELAELDPQTVLEIHVAGSSQVDESEWARDSHSAPVADQVYRWLEALLPQMTSCEAIILERDADYAADVIDDLHRLHALVD